MQIVKSFGKDKHGFRTDPSTDEVFMESHRKDCILKTDPSTDEVFFWKVTEKIVSRNLKISENAM